MHRLAPHPLPPGARPARATEAYSPAHLDDSVLKVMTDLRRYRAVTCRGSATLAVAERLMISAGVRLLLVVDSTGVIIGLVTYRDLVGEHALAVAARERTAHEELQVSQVMTPASQIEALDMRQVEHARVRDLVDLMRKRGRQHALVTEMDEANRPVVRGIFSITQIGRQLGVPIEASGQAQSFAEIENLIAHA